MDKIQVDKSMPTLLVPVLGLDLIRTPGLVPFYTFVSLGVAGVKGNFRHSWDDLACRYCDLGDDESQEHLEMCGGTEFERRGLELRNWRDQLLFWRRMTVKIAAVTKKKGPVT